MEEIIETPPEGESGPEDDERQAFRELNEDTFQPEAGLERGGNIEEAEGIEAAFVELIDLNAEAPEISSTPHEEGEDTEYRVKVEFPWIGDADDEDEETDWARVASLATDGDGTWYLPEVEDEVMADTDNQAPLTDDIQPAGKDDPTDRAPLTDDLQPTGEDDGGDDEGRD